ncbi:MAG: hypothetical protein OEY97_13750 [Nitrospirota bacterium]|nr:hypothetical protein [Nitrospirota bacterium]
MAASIGTAMKNIMLDRTLRGTGAATNGVLDGGTAVLEIYDGVRPANADTAVTTQVLLASLPLPASAFAAAAAGASSLSAQIQDNLADASGTATWFRLRDSAGTYVIDGSVTATGGGGDIELSDVNILANGTVTITAFNISIL